MKTYLFLLSLLLVIGCTPVLDNMEQFEADRRSVRTKAAETETYYWYESNKIPLTLDLQNVNVIYSESVTKGALSDQTCKQSAIARDANLTPPASSPKLDYFVTSGVDSQAENFIVMAYSQNATVSFAQKPAQINTAYTYYWHFSTSGDYNWKPYYTLVGNYNGVNMSIPRPSTDSVLTVSCEVYNGSTHVCTATKSLTVRLSFP